MDIYSKILQFKNFLYMVCLYVRAHMYIIHSNTEYFVCDLISNNAGTTKEESMLSLNVQNTTTVTEIQIMVHIIILFKRKIYKTCGNYSY